MIQTVRIIREKADDIWALYITEFLKFTGCIVSDYVLPDSVKAGIDLEGNYDAELVLNYDETKWNGDYYILDEKQKSYYIENAQNVLNHAKRIELRERDYDEEFMRQEIMENSGDSKILTAVVDAIWNQEKPEIKRELKYLVYAYARSNIFFYLYNEGNLKFIQEYYPLKGQEIRKDSNPRWEAYDISFNRFAICNNILAKYAKMILQIESEYFEFARIYIRYKINEMSEYLQERKLFYIEYLLKDIESIKRKNSEFARINYLAANICRTDRKYWCDTTFYYGLVEKNFIQIGFPKKEKYFLYYQWGRFYEKKMENKEEAYKLYSKALECGGNSYRAHYKILRNLKEKGELSTVIDGGNKIIQQILNGYRVEKVLPKQKIYSYKCFVLMGDCYYGLGVYDLALTCYLRAEKISMSETEFYSVLKKENESCFEENFKTCMPLRQIYYKIIDCASKGNERDIIDTYLEKI